MYLEIRENMGDEEAERLDTLVDQGSDVDLGWLSDRDLADMLLSDVAVEERMLNVAVDFMFTPPKQREMTGRLRKRLAKKGW